ncbi:hypothetical protein BJ170DRAFT_64697 [Xylariales sp. AK1849]|nr:hypothetical protein BJ170DRAFT_64697 [Xylariales sp. AK1849]
MLLSYSSSLLQLARRLRPLPGVSGTVATRAKCLVLRSHTSDALALCDVGGDSSSRLVYTLVGMQIRAALPLDSFLRSDGLICSLPRPVLSEIRIFPSVRGSPPDHHWFNWDPGSPVIFISYLCEVLTVAVRDSIVKSMHVRLQGLTMIFKRRRRADCLPWSCNEFTFCIVLGQVCNIDALCNSSVIWYLTCFRTVDLVGQRVVAVWLYCKHRGL